MSVLTLSVYAGGLSLGSQDPLAGVPKREKKSGCSGECKQEHKKKTLLRFKQSLFMGSTLDSTSGCRGPHCLEKSRKDRQA